MISLERYRKFVDAPKVRAALLASVPGRIPIGMAGLAILLFVQGKSGSFAQAGMSSALYVLGLAIVAPFLGRLIDRTGPAQVLRICRIVYPCALVAVVVLVTRSADAIWIAICAFAAGSALPPITICMRTLYPRLLDDPSLLQTAYSVDSALIETIFVLGPALVAIFVAIRVPGGAVLFAALCASIGATVFARSPAIKDWAPRAARIPPGTRGVLRHSSLLAVLAATMMYSVAFGLFEVAVTAFAARKGVPAAAGLILALASIGSALGALIYGSRSWAPPLPRQFLLGLLAMAGGTLLIAPITNVYAFALLSIVAGAPMATVIAVQSTLISRLAPREMVAESFTWAATCLLVGISVGIAAGGMLAEVATPPLILIAAATATGIAGIIASVRLSAMAPTVEERQAEPRQL